MAIASNREGGSPRATHTLHSTTTDRGPLFDGDEEFMEGHSHTWRVGDARTSVDKGHSHRVVLGRIQRSPNDGHRHTMAEEVKELERIRDSGIPSFFGKSGGRREAPGSL